MTKQAKPPVRPLAAGDERTWSRRSFMALLGVSAAAVAVRLPAEADRPRSPWRKNCWIGHC